MYMIFFAGNIAVSRSVAARISTEDNRAKVLSMLSLSQSFGYCLGPGYFTFLFSFVWSKSLY